MRRPVIAVDGPAGAGKSTVSRQLARAFGFRYVDTGAMYRVVGVLADRRGIDFGDAEALSELCENLTIVFEERDDGHHVLADGQDMSAAIRTVEAGQLASKVSVVSAVRQRLVALQRRFGEGGGIVMEGRDIGTVVFPEADLKVFLTASAGARARRRCAELRARGVAADPAAVEREIAERDERDRGREDSPLRPAADAVVVDTTRDPVEKVVRRLRGLVCGFVTPCNRGHTEI